MRLKTLIIMLIIVVIITAVVLVLPVFIFTSDFYSAVVEKDSSRIEKYVEPPMSIFEKDGYVWIGSGEEELVPYSLCAVDSTYTLRLSSYKVESFTKMHLIFEGFRYRPNETDGMILFYNIYIERKGLMWVISNYETDI